MKTYNEGMPPMPNKTDDKNINYLITSAAVMGQKFEDLKNDVHEIRDTVKASLVTTERFQRLQDRVVMLERAVYGFVGLALVLLLTAIITSRLK